MERWRDIDWRAPTLMMGSLLAGVAFALGHHFFNLSLVHDPSSSAITRFVGMHHTDQQFNIAVGTAFAFLVKAALVLAVSVAYFQAFWRAARTWASKTPPPTLGSLDTTFAGPFSFTGLFKLSTWARYPVLFLVTLSTWLIPIASIITPGTLSVEFREHFPNSSVQAVPGIDFANLNFVAGMQSLVPSDGLLYNGVNYQYVYNGPSQVVKQLAAAVAAQGAILPITPPYTNSSWSVDFHGPNIRCNPLSDEQSSVFQSNIAGWLKQGENCYSAPTFLSWFPRLNFTTNITDIDPFVSSTGGKNLHFPDPNAIFSLNGHQTSTVFQDAFLYLAVLPNMLLYANEGFSSTPRSCSFFVTDNDTSVGDQNPLGTVGGNITMYRCDLHNSTYRAAFTYENGAQNISLDFPDPSSDLPVPLIDSVFAAWTNTSALPPSENNTCGSLSTHPTDLRDSGACTFDPSILPLLSYQAVLQAFSSLVTGAISLRSLDLSGAAGSSNGLTETSAIRSTALLDSAELRYLSDYDFIANNPSNTSSDYLQFVMSHSDRSEEGGMGRLRGATTRDGLPRSLPGMLEGLFRNLTVSLMSSPALRPDPSSGDDFRVEVTEYTSRIVYAYDGMRLWAAYGSAIFIAVCSVMVGVVAMIGNRAAYDGNFSTVFLAALAARLGTEVERRTPEGRAPLPKYLERATVELDAGWEGRESEEVAMPDEEDTGTGEGTRGGKGRVEVGERLLI